MINKALCNKQAINSCGKNIIEHFKQILSAYYCQFAYTNVFLLNIKLRYMMHIASSQNTLSLYRNEFTSPWSNY